MLSYGYVNKKNTNNCLLNYCNLPYCSLKACPNGPGPVSTGFKFFFVLNRTKRLIPPVSKAGRLFREAASEIATLAQWSACANCFFLISKISYNHQGGILANILLYDQNIIRARIRVNQGLI